MIEYFPVSLPTDPREPLRCVFIQLLQLLARCRKLRFLNPAHWYPGLYTNRVSGIVCFDLKAIIPSTPSPFMQIHWRGLDNETMNMPLLGIRYRPGVA
jgi:hypothetical protein